MKWRAWHGYALLALLVLPLFFISVRDTHDWGDDFAQYIIQAKELSEGGPVDPDAAVLNWAAHGPAPKGLGFSILLMPVHAWAGVKVRPYLFFNTIVLCIGGVLFYAFLRRDFPVALGLGGTALLLYDRHVLQAKAEIMPDLLLMALVVATVYLLARPVRRTWWSVALVVGFAALLKTAGWVLVPVLWIEALRARWKGAPQAPRWSALVFVFVMPVALGLVVPAWLSGSEASGSFWYTELMQPGRVLRNAGSNAWTYMGHTLVWFEQELPMWMNRMLVPLVLALMLCGVVVRAWKGIGAPELIMVGWWGMLLVYPDVNSATRFMLPLLPLALQYLLHGTAWVVRTVKMPEAAMPVGLGLFLLASADTVRWAVRVDPSQGSGPYAHHAADAFLAIKKHVSAGQTVASTRPWALHLFTGRPAMWAASPTDPGRSVPHVAHIAPDLMFVATDPREKGIFDEGLLRMVRSDDHWMSVWRNDRFALFQRKAQTE